MDANVIVNAHVPAHAALTASASLLLETIHATKHVTKQGAGINVGEHAGRTKTTEIWSSASTEHPINLAILTLTLSNCKAEYERMMAESNSSPSTAAELEPMFSQVNIRWVTGCTTPSTWRSHGTSGTWLRKHTDGYLTTTNPTIEYTCSDFPVEHIKFGH